jgi:hypothetical protein
MIRWANPIGQELLIITMRTRPPTLKGLPVLLNTTPASSVPPAKRDRPPGRKQAKEKQVRSREVGEEYMKVWGSFLQMKTEEHKQREVRWNRSNLLEERKLQIEE